MATELTNSELKALKCPSNKSSVEIKDGKVPGLQVRVGKSKKSFSLMYRMHGRQKRMRLGDFPEISLSDARAAAYRALALISEGLDPEEVKKQERQEKAVELGVSTLPTLRVIGTEFSKYHLPHLRPITQKNYIRRLNKYIYPVLGNRPIDTIGKKDLVHFIEKIAVDNGTPGEALFSYAVLSALLTFAHDRDYIQFKPILPKKVKSQIKAKVKPRTHTYTEEEIKLHWAYFDQLNRPVSKVYLKLLYHLALRKSELQFCEWVFIDWQKKSLLIPGQLTKNKTDHLIPLTEEVIRLFKSLESITGDKAYIFCDEFEPKPFQIHTSIKNARNMLGHFAPHDIRRTVRSKWAQLGVQRDVAEMMLNHTPDILIQTYDQYDYLKEKRAAYALWGEELGRLVGGELNRSSFAI